MGDQKNFSSTLDHKHPDNIQPTRAHKHKHIHIHTHKHIHNV